MGAQRNNVFSIDKNKNYNEFYNNQDQASEFTENEEIYTLEETEYDSTSSYSGNINLQQLLINSSVRNLSKKPSSNSRIESNHPLREGSDTNMVDKRIDRLEMELEKHQEITDLKLKNTEQRLESKIDNSMNEVLSAIDKMEARINEKINIMQTATISQMTELKNQGLTTNDVKVIISEEIRNSSNLKHTRSGVYIAAGAGLVSVVALLFQIFG
ncbi:hypothetical protein [Exiguobacterium sp. USCH10]|jgi:hypothetical protein|uniref:hypothetical protein n=1 Tax=Exiguobacterium sp. USCH10 TaxID=3024839 RepID=UPI0030B5A150